MRVTYYLILIVTFLTMPLFAEQLNVITNSEKSSIYINNQLLGRHQLLNHELLPGTYLITVKEKKAIIYSEIVEIEQDKVKTININVETTLSKDIDPVKNRKKQANYALRKEKGNFGVGLYFAGVENGLKLSHDFLFQTNLQAVIAMYSSQDYEYTVLGGKFVKYFKSQYTKHTLARLYTGIGGIYSNIDSVTRRSVEIPFGLELMLKEPIKFNFGQRFPLPNSKGPDYYYFSFIYYYSLMYVYFLTSPIVLASHIDGMYYFVETGLTYMDISDGRYYRGTKLALGFNYYF